MSPRDILRNYHLEPSTDKCTCELDPRCGGIVHTPIDCPEHGAHVRSNSVLLKSHFHPIQAAPENPVGSRVYP